MCRVFDKYRQSIPDAMAKEKVPGLSLALADREGILWAAGFGYTDYDQKTPVTTDTMFALCSISKIITATAVMIAVQDGLLELDVPIVEYFPQFTVNSRFEDNPHKKITLRHVLNHTSGIVHEAPVGNAREPSYGTLEEHVLSVSDTWLRHKVGERFSYSGFGYDLIAYILQVQSGQPFAEYIKTKVFAPLKMTNCSADPEFIRSHPNKAVGHMPYVKRTPMVWDIPYAGAGSVYASARGLATFVQLFLNGGKVDGQTILDESSIKSMVTPSKYSAPSNYKYGLGVMVYDQKYYALGHRGGGGGFQSAMFWYPEYEFGIVLMLNSEEFKHPVTVAIDLIEENLVEKSESFEILSVEYEAYRTLDPNTFTRFKPEWKKYIGTYRYTTRGWKVSTPLRIALALGLTTKYTHVKIFEQDGYLYVDSQVYHDDDGGRLDEYLPGLFFTPSGKCLDLRGPKLTWQNWRIKKFDDDTDRRFDLSQ
jgi:CubicO group peptidase (beta-lactamase class C family)